MNRIVNVAKIIISSFFPNTCVACDDIIEEGEHLCHYCHEMIERCDPTKRCIKCGLRSGNCDCKTKVYYYSGCIAPFYSTEISRKAMYGYKFERKMKNIDFFATNMALVVKNEYRDIHFDGICYVPLSFKNELKRGFNQSRILAQKVSDLTGIVVIDNALECRKSNVSQHELSEKERLDHVRGLYSWKFKNTGKTILLIDDIKTTGATLNECSRQLLASGASEIYCVTALIADKLK